MWTTLAASHHSSISAQAECRARHIGLRIEHAGYLAEWDGRARKRTGNLRHAAGTAIGQPFAGVGVGIIERGDRLEIQDHDGGFGVLNDGQNRGRRRVSAHVAKDQIDARAAESFARLKTFGGIVHKARADDIGPPADALLDFALIAFEALFEPMKLRPVGSQANPILQPLPSQVPAQVPPLIVPSTRLLDVNRSVEI